MSQLTMTAPPYAPVLLYRRAVDCNGLPVCRVCDKSGVNESDVLPFPDEGFMNSLNALGVPAEQVMEFYDCLLVAVTQGELSVDYIRTKNAQVVLSVPLEHSQELSPVLSIVHALCQPEWTLYTANSSYVITDYYALDEQE